MGTHIHTNTRWHTNKHKWTNMDVIPCCLMWFGVHSQYFSVHWNISRSSLTHATRDWWCVFEGFHLQCFPLVFFFCIAITCNIFIFFCISMPFQISFVLHFGEYEVCEWVVTLQTVVAGQPNAYFWDTVACVDSVAKQKRKDRQANGWIENTVLFLSLLFFTCYMFWTYILNHSRKIVAKLHQLFSGMTVPTVGTFPLQPCQKQVENNRLPPGLFWGREMGWKGYRGAA